MRRIRLLLLPALLVALVVGAPAARADDPIATSYRFEGRLGADGMLQVTEKIVFDAPPGELTQRLATTAPIDSRSFYRYEISDIAATGAEGLEVSTDGDYQVLKMKPSTEVTITYNVRGTTAAGAAGDEHSVFSWRPLQGLSVAVKSVTGELKAGSLPEYVDCTAGAPGAPNKCSMVAVGTFDAPNPRFESAARGVGEQVTLTVGYPKAAVEATAVVHESWSLDRAFTVNLATIGAALGALALGVLGLWWLYRLTGMDQVHSGEVTPIGTFRPTGDGQSVFEVADGIRPGLVGTLADERVDPVDITATLLDLAVRGHLRITELNVVAHGLPDWRFTRIGDEAGLADYEKRLLEAVTPGGGEILASELPTTLSPALPGIQDALYDEVVAKGWFDVRPDSTRNSWRTWGIVAVVASVAALVALAAFTKFGVLGIVLVGLAATLLSIGSRMPRRSVAGSHTLSGLGALSALLATHPTDQMPKGRELVEISKLLPYAVVLGGKQRWLGAMVDADDDDRPDPTDLAWYHAPETWHLRDLPASLTQFVNTVQGELFSR